MFAGIQESCASKIEKLKSEHSDIVTSTKQQHQAELSQCEFKYSEYLNLVKLVCDVVTWCLKMLRFCREIEKNVTYWVVIKLLKYSLYPSITWVKTDFLSDFSTAFSTVFLILMDISHFKFDNLVCIIHSVCFTY